MAYTLKQKISLGALISLLILSAVVLHLALAAYPAIRAFVGIAVLYAIGLTILVKS